MLIVNQNLQAHNKYQKAKLNPYLLDVTTFFVYVNRGWRSHKPELWKWHIMSSAWKRFFFKHISGTTYLISGTTKEVIAPKVSKNWTARHLYKIYFVAFSVIIYFIIICFNCFNKFSFLLLYHRIIYFTSCIIIGFNNFLLLYCSARNGWPLQNQPLLKGDPP